MRALGFAQDFQTYLKTVATTPPEDETDEKKTGVQTCMLTPKLPDVMFKQSAVLGAVLRKDPVFSGVLQIS